MSLVPVPTGEPVTTAFGTALATAASTFLPKLFGGGNGGPNIARSLSKQVGFQVLQSDAATVRARLASGLDPRTGIATSNRVALSRPPVVNVKGLVGGLLKRFAPPVLAPAIPFVAKRVSEGLPSIESIINRPASGTPPPLSLPPAVPLPSISRAVLSTPALPRRQMVPPGGGKVSLIPAAGMASVGAMARMGGRGLMRTATGRISRIMLPSGQVFSRKNAASLIRRVGFEAAAVALGITVFEAAELLLADSQTRRRGKGITAAQLRNAKSTTCRVRNAARTLGIRSTAAPRRRKTSCR